ncbi:MAG: hypothetical protein IT260_04765, partial [Saprospiraceae bacterium]|nr:hypothetical protein [Saprospiraceae bacterium]
MRLRVLRAGLLSTGQDLGRYGWQASGVPVGGALDADSHRLANLVLGNPADAASLEIVPGPGWLAEVEQAGWLAAAGAGMGWLI